VTEPRENDYEILDLGSRRRTDTGRQPRDLPPMHLGAEQPAGEPPGSTMPPWRRLAGIAAVFVVGAAAGAFLWNARDEAAELAAAAEEAHLIAGSIEGGSWAGEEVQRFTVAMLNAGPRDVEVLSVRPVGWTLPSGNENRPQTAATGEWTSIRMATVPDCEAPTPDELEVRVRTEARESAVTLQLPPGGSVLAGVHQAVCVNDFSAYGARVEDIRVLPSDDPGTLLMELELRSYDPNLDFDVIEVNASAAGFRAEPTNLPIPFRTNVRTPSPLVLAWQVQNCDLVAALGDIGIMLEITSTQGTDHVDNPPLLPGEGVAALARFGLDRCGT